MDMFHVRYFGHGCFSEAAILGKKPSKYKKTPKPTVVGESQTQKFTEWAQLWEVFVCRRVTRNVYQQ